MRCEIGWPMPTPTGSSASRPGYRPAAVPRPAGLQVHVQLAQMHPFGMFVQLRTPGAAADMADFGNLQQQLFRRLADTVALAQAGAGLQAAG